MNDQYRIKVACRLCPRFSFYLKAQVMKLAGYKLLLRKWHSRYYTEIKRLWKLDGYQKISQICDELDGKRINGFKQKCSLKCCWIKKGNFISVRYIPECVKCSISPVSRYVIVFGVPVARNRIGNLENLAEGLEFGCFIGQGLIETGIYDKGCFMTAIF